ncbi:hypothetical protein ES702_02072 [subsurface metagenome]
MFKSDFKKVLLLSSIIHFTIIGGLIFGWQFSSPKPKPRTVYTVKVVELPEERPKLREKKTVKKEKKKERKKISFFQKRRKLEEIRKKKESERKKELRKKEEELRKLEVWSKEEFKRPRITSSAKSLIFLDIPKIPSWYVRLIHDKIYGNWEPPPGTEKEKVTIFFEINQEGQILKSSVEKTSRFSDFDRAALEAVKKSDPLPSLPPQYREKILRAHLTFKYERD